MYVTWSTAKFKLFQKSCTVIYLYTKLKQLPVWIEFIAVNLHQSLANELQQTLPLNEDDHKQSPPPLHSQSHTDFQHTNVGFIHQQL